MATARIREWLAGASRSSDGRQIQLEYPLRPESRYGWGKPEHPRLRSIIAAGDPRYKERLQSFLALQDQLVAIPVEAGPEGLSSWLNPYFFGLDTAALYALVTELRPAQFLEIGSGYSTKIARRAITDGGLDTKVKSIDPDPRVDVDQLCDEVYRSGLEEVDLEIFDALQTDDILFMDGSHYSFMNSDSTVFFLDVLPRLRPGVIVHLHDIFLPSDYRPDWAERYYTEQYLLAAHLLSGSASLEVILPVFYISTQPHLAEILAPMWERLGLTGYERAGHSFWMRTVAA